MAFTKYQIFLSIVMVTTGTINVLGNEWTDHLWGKGSNGKVHKFDHPFVQTIFMFGGEILCLLAFKVLVGFYSRRQLFAAHADIISGNREFNPFILFPAAMFDMIGTSVMYLGLVLTTAPSFQMLRGSVIVFVALLSYAFLGRRIQMYQKIGIFFIVIGLGVVGFSDYANKSTDHSSSEMISGDVLVVIAQIITACQMVYEEKFVVEKNIPPLQAVGWEGTFGLLTLSFLLIPFYFINVGKFGKNPRQVLEDFPDAIIQIKNNPVIGFALASTMISIACLNFSGVSITKEISATARMVMDTVRTFFVWIICLMLQWQDFHPLQVLGFGIVLFGMIIYYQVIGCGRNFAVVETAPSEDQEPISTPADQP